MQGNSDGQYYCTRSRTDIRINNKRLKTMAKINLGRVKFSFQGDWNNDTNYRKDDVVWFDNSL